MNIRGVLYSTLASLRPAWLAQRIKEAAGIERRVVQTREGAFYIDPVSLLGQYLLSDGVHEKEMVRVVKTILRPGDVFIDAGANEGYFSVIASRIVGKGRSIAIEPQSRLIEVIKKNAEINSVEIEVLRSAVSNKNGEAEIKLAPAVNSGSSGFMRKTRYSLPSERVKKRTLSSILNQIDVERVDLLKMDIEGHEYEAVMGSKEVFRSHRVKAIALELHTDILTEKGYSAK